ncbi:MAG: bacillithiol biosynthesis cysteine-adding enzyme BshC [Candidatus Latescibacteria bacterium]|nr:bacillithiol biosynthesis cysteine-adding enzyme BshC [Candidatus Latescibacterota bacterium]
MIRCIDAHTFFDGNPPPGIPGDAPKPDFERLVERTRFLDTSRYPLKRLKEILEREHIRLGAGAETLERIAAVGEDSVFVVAGQQAGLFGGPLYTLYKAMHAVRLAERLQEASGRRVVPLFWIASDDHDFGEVDHLGLNTRDGSSAIVSYRPGGHRDGMPVSGVTLDEVITDVIDTFAGALPSGGIGKRLLTILRESWKPGVSWPDAFARHLLALFREWGLTVFDPVWSGVRELFGAIYLKELSDPSASVALINEGADDFDSARLKKKALRKPASSTNLFLVTDGIRHAVTFADGVFTAGGRRFSMDELRALAGSEPERFSPAAGLRPVCQDAVMPVSALIAGPGERLYLRQVRPLYDLFGVDGSTVWPRASFTVVDVSTVRAAEKEGIPLKSAFGDIGSIKNMLARDTFPADVRDTFDTLEREMETGFARIADTIGAVDPTLVDAAKKEAGRVSHILAGLRGKAVRAHKSTVGVSERRLTSASYYLLPDRGPQERWFGADAILTSLAGDGFGAFIAMTSPGEERHRIVLPG